MMQGNMEYHVNISVEGKKMRPWWFDFPAKTRKDGHFGPSVFEHGLLAAEVFLAYRELRDWQREGEMVPASLALPIAVHDIGKINPMFLKKLLKSVSQEEREHWEHLCAELEGIDRELVRHEAVSAEVLIALRADKNLALEVVGDHHSKRRLNTKRAPLAAMEVGGAEWQSYREEVVRLLADDLGLSLEWPTPCGSRAEKRAQRQLWLGHLILADWLASRRNEPFAIADVKTLAKMLLQEAGFRKAGRPSVSAFSDLFGYQARKAQSTFEHLYAGPGVYVLEAPTGYGKTEAALGMSAKALAAGDADGIYFALPTQLTSNLMLGRIKKFVSTAYGEQWAVQLVHSGRRLKEIAMGKEAAPGEEWFKSNRQALLAPFAVGTADQALLASLPVKFAALRLAGLAGKVVILDEIHSYDAYTAELIRKLLTVLQSLKAVVIILSATLTDKALAQMLDVEPTYWKGYKSALRFTVKDGDGLKVEELPIAPEDNRPIQLKLSSEDDAAFDEAVARAQAGQYVLWIENTVKKAQEMAGAFEQAGIQTGLLHSRFRQIERSENEDIWTHKFGKAGQITRGQSCGCVLVGTQVLEQSLDIDADFLVTRLAPIDLLVQRLGRLWRHKETPRPQGCREAESWILCSRGCDSLRPFENTVYYQYVLARTLETLSTHDLSKPILFPETVRMLIEETYAERSEELGTPAFEMKQVLDRERKSMIERAESIETHGSDEEPATRYITLPEYEVLVLYDEELQGLPTQQADLAVWAEARIVRLLRPIDGTACGDWKGWSKDAQKFFAFSRRFKKIPVQIVREGNLTDPETQKMNGRYDKKIGSFS